MSDAPPVMFAMLGCNGDGFASKKPSDEISRATNEHHNRSQIRLRKSISHSAHSRTKSQNQRQSVPTEAAVKSEIPPLLRVPPEIRREIYRYLLPSPPGRQFRIIPDRTTANSCGFKWARPNSSKREPREPCSLAILRTNHMIYYEALAMLYSENKFHFITVNYLPVLDFVRRLSPEARDLMRQVRLTLSAIPEQEIIQRRPSTHDTFCTVLYDYLTGLTNLHADPWTWI